MAVYSFEWKSGLADNPTAFGFTDDHVVKEADSQTWKAGFPLAVDLSESGSGTTIFKRADAMDLAVFIAATDAVNASADVDLTQPGVNKASLPYILRPGDILSVSVSSSGANTATSDDYIGKVYGWAVSTESGETTKAVLDVADQDPGQFLVIGYDDRDAVGTSGGRMLVMWLPSAAGTWPDATTA